MEARNRYLRPWRQPDGLPPYSYLPQAPEVLRRILWHRDYRDEDAARAFLNPDRFVFPTDDSYPALVRAVDRIERAIRDCESIWVWGDYDADGQTATALLVGALRDAGATVDYYIPNRLRDAHGLHDEGLDRLAREGCGLLITCDCGTSDVRQAAYARSLGIEVIITDHHAQLGELPDVYALVNPTQLSTDHPLYGLPGVGVVYLLTRVLAAHAGNPALADSGLDLVALGIIADVAPNTPVNRALLVRGLPRLWRDPRPGIAALLRLAKARPSLLDTTSISYKLAPLLNAAGRLTDAREGVELLLAAGARDADALALRLQSLNDERRRLEAALEAEVVAQLTPEEQDMPILVLDGVGWHPGLIGVVATRLAQRYGRPAVLITRSTDGSPARGSGRGYGGISLLDAFSSQAGLLRNFGGHQGAAGFDIDEERIPDFRRGIAAAVALVRPIEGGATLAIDAELDWSEIDTHDLGARSLFARVARVAPFASGNPPPVFASFGLRVLRQTRFGDTGQHLRLSLADERGSRRDVVCWRYDAPWEPTGIVDVAYRLERDEWQGLVSVQLTLEGLRPHGGRVQ